MKIDKDELLYAMNLTNMEIEFQRIRDFIRSTYPNNRGLNMETLKEFNLALNDREKEKIDFVNELGEKYIGPISLNEYYYIDFTTEEISKVENTNVHSHHHCDSCANCSKK